MDAGQSRLQPHLEWTKEEVDKIISSSNEESRKVHIIIGNESGDLDSAVAAIVYSYFKQKKAKSSSAETYVPVFNIPEDELILKTEVNAIFERLGLKTAGCIVFKDCLSKLASLNAISEVILVDHNALSQELIFLDHFVTTIIDHHVDSGAFDDLCISKTIETVGSCCTLIAEKIYNSLEDMFSEYPISELLMSAICLDTVNLKQGIGRTSVKDVEFVEELESKSTIAQQELFDIAQKAKYDVAHLPVKDILRKDFKAVSNDDQSQFGISSITMPAEEFLCKEDCLEQVAMFAEKNHLKLTILMFIHCKNEETKRELVVYAIDSSFRESFSKYVLNIAELKLEKLEHDSSFIDYFSQGDPRYSRKILTPFVVNFFNKKYVLGRNLMTNFENGEDILSTSIQGLKSSQNVLPGETSRENLPTHNQTLNTKNSYTENSPDTLETKPFVNDFKVDARNLDFRQESDVVENSSNCMTDATSMTNAESPIAMTISDSFNMSSSAENLHNSIQHEPGVKAALQEAYADMDLGLDQPSLEFEEHWKSEMYDVKSPCSPTVDTNRKHKIVIRDLSFDDNGPFSELSGIDLLCPVFLAVTEDDEDDDVVLKDIRRKTKSIENLCSALDDEQDFPLRRTKSELPSSRKTIRKLETGAEKWKTTSSEKRVRRMDRNDSIKEEDISFDENPFAGDKDFSDESDVNSSMHSSASSSGFGSHPTQAKSLEDISDDAASPTYCKQVNGEKIVERFSFSDDEYDACCHESISQCDCKNAERNELANQIGPVKHVPGLWDRFISVSVGGLLRVVDLKLIDPYIKVITHGGIHEVNNERRVVMVFTAAYLPHKYIPKYNIVMEQLFYYAVHTIDLSVGENYDIVYFNANGANQPGLNWLKRCYDMVERRLKKNLRTLFLVHPDLWLKTVLRFYKPFISSKFSRNIKLMKSLHDLRKNLSLEYIFIPDEVKRNDPDASYWLQR